MNSNLRKNQDFNVLPSMLSSKSLTNGDENKFRMPGRQDSQENIQQSSQKSLYLRNSQNDSSHLGTTISENPTEKNEMTPSKRTSIDIEEGSEALPPGDG